ncbi:MAG: GNAT family N-acetyltransferase [Candidatus Thorarchaeota archaeon]
MRKRTILIIIFVTTSFIVQMVGVPFLGFKYSSHDLEFEYEYKWDLIGIGGWYAGYEETTRVNGHYIINFNNNFANVTARVSWKFTESYYGTTQRGVENYVFSYSLINGSYIWGTDQDILNTTGMNVWFHIPGGIQVSQYDILDTSYNVIGGDHLIWVGHLMPFSGKKLHSEGYYFRDDIYGEFDVNYEVDNFFTKEGYLIGEIYKEVDTGYDRDTGLWSKFKINSYVFITSSSYLRPFNFGMYFTAYWLPIIIFMILFYVLYENLRWKSRVVLKGDILIKIERNLPNFVRFEVKSPYSEMIPSFLGRAKSHGKRIISAHRNGIVEGIGFIEPKGKVGTFYGSHVSEMVRYAKSKYVFTENDRLKGFHTIEKYNIFEIINLQQYDFSFDTAHLGPIEEPHLDAIMQMIANEDSGKRSKKYAKWVINSYEDDIAIGAIAVRTENWIKPILSDLYRRNYPIPELVNNKIILGVGFATPGEDTGWLYGLYVHPAFRNHGIGRMLVLARFSALKELGCTRVITEIAEWNSPAINIYNDYEPLIVGNINLLGKKMPKVKVRRY